MVIITSTLDKQPYIKRLQVVIQKILLSIIITDNHSQSTRLHVQQVQNPCGINVQSVH
jgi:hypothetical protein